MIAGSLQRAVLSSLVLIFGAGAYVGAAGASDGRVATLKSVSGDISVVRDEATVEGGSGMKLLVSDRIVSGSDSSAVIVFKDATVVTLGPSADVQVRNFVFEPHRKKYDFNLYLAKGAAIYSSGLIGQLSPKAVKVATPIATIGIRGTRFIVDAGSAAR